MPRGPRVDFPGAMQHVYARGIEKRKIFFDAQDFRKFLGGLGENLPRWGVHCFAWALMPNHLFVILDRISYSTGIPRERIAGGRKYAEVQARRRVLVECVSGMEVSVACICRWLGITAGAGEYLVRTAEGDRRSFEERPGS